MEDVPRLRESRPTRRYQRNRTSGELLVMAYQRLLPSIQRSLPHNVEAPSTIQEVELAFAERSVSHG